MSSLSSMWWIWLIIAACVILGILLIVAILAIVSYNNAAKKKLRVDNAFSQIKIQYKRRADLVPYLTDVVKSYIKHTQITLERPAAQDPVSPEQLSDADHQTGRVLHELYTLASHNPGLHTNAHFMQLQSELTALEKAIAHSRGFYNDAVMLYNRAVQTFPTLVFARMFKFKPAAFLDTSAHQSDSVIRGVLCPACGALSHSEICPACNSRIPLF